jgi:hypothetical protein
MSCSTITSVRPSVTRPDQRHGRFGLGAAHAGGGFVEQDHLRVAGDRDADLQRALLGVGEDAGRRLRTCREPHALDDLPRALVGVGEAVGGFPERVAVAERPQHRAAHVLEHAEAMKQVRHLEAARQPEAVDLVRLPPRDRLAVERDAALAGCKACGDQVEQHRLSGAVRPDERVALAALDAQVHAAHDLGRAEALSHARELEARRSRASSASVGVARPSAARARHSQRHAASPPTSSAIAPPTPRERSHAAIGHLDRRHGRGHAGSAERRSPSRAHRPARGPSARVPQRFCSTSTP